MTLAQMADRLGLQSGEGLRRQVLRGALRAEKIGKTWVVSEAEVERYRDEHLGQRGNRAPAPGRKSVRDAGETSAERDPEHRPA